MEFSSSHYRNQEGMTLVEKRSTGKRYNGLKNQGATCYLNSVLQCLYMTEDFRKEVENFRAYPPNYDESSTDLMLELQKLFAKIKDDDGTTEGITQSLCISNVYEQQDAVEYYQRTLKAIGPQFSKVFEGKMSNIAKCTNNHKFQEKCHFFTIPLPIETGHMDVFEVDKGLQTFFKKVKLDEDNWLYCEHCGKKTETETWNEIQEFPTILTLYPKRFDFDYTQMRLVKNNCHMDIPLQLQISDIVYKLYAVINHSGGVSGGHYNAVIKSFEDDEWYCFDDYSVTKDSKHSFYLSRLAYLLMYRKVDFPDEKSASELQLHFQEYYKLVTNLLQWIRYYISVFEESKFPTSYKEIETLCQQFLEFKMIELPAKEADKICSKHIYKTFQGAVQAGQIPPGYNPNDVEKKWSQLHEAIIKWEGLLRNKFEQVYCFHEHLVNMRVMFGNTVSVYGVPLTPSQLDEVMLCYIHDLLDWVKKNQSYMHYSEWGADLPSIESHLASHQRLHQSIKDFKSNIQHAEADEYQLSHASKKIYRNYLDMLVLQYKELLNSSVARLQNLTGLHVFAVAATDALIWLSERTEEEVKYGWSDDNTNMTAKKDNYSGLMQDLEQMKKKLSTIKATGDKLLKEDHPAQRTIEALTAALETQWTCLQQFCCCTETHLKENTTYFQTQDCNNALQNMKQHHCNFTSNSKHSEFFGADEHKQAESTYNNAKKHCNNLLQSMKQDGSPTASNEGSSSSTSTSCKTRPEVSTAVSRSRDHEEDGSKTRSSSRSTRSSRSDTKKTGKAKEVARAFEESCPRQEAEEHSPPNSGHSELKMSEDEQKSPMTSPTHERKASDEPSSEKFKKSATLATPKSRPSSDTEAEDQEIADMEKKPINTLPVTEAKGAEKLEGVPVATDVLQETVHQTVYGEVERLTPESAESEDKDKECIVQKDSEEAALIIEETSDKGASNLHDPKQFDSSALKLKDEPLQDSELQEQKSPAEHQSEKHQSEEENLKAGVTSASTNTQAAGTEEEKPNISKQEDEVTIKENTADEATTEKRAAIKEEFKQTYKDELNQEPDPKKPCSQPSTTNDFTLPPFSPDNPIGVDFVVPKTGFFCKLCSLFYGNEETAKKTHCSSLRHYQNMQKYYEKLKTQQTQSGSSAQTPSTNSFSSD
ncbi:uncharacterized protein si:ch211-212k18.13 isoform X1 [Ictalurus furcatus]|uniref:uncharacterized protein si:ch211-212k18.13 isoform X1 n=1 Tax=Ictalurus furcatus TaxID=66913 RepID=UPI0023506248|nr:uncharacterized protein si:ch211-212k18.13 isoform X1 [Ictalurus furcatus]